jgi:hypothetical protein
MMGSTVAVGIGSGPAHAAGGAKFIRPLVSSAENATTSWGRDGGISVALPGNKVFWIFGDTPRYTYSHGTWKLSAFIYGSSAGIGSYSPGKPPSARFYEVVKGKKPGPSTKPAQFLPRPRLYVPNGSGKVCNKKNGGPSTGAGRWPTGAVLLPDKTNILVSYIGVCVINATTFRAESWGFAKFNYKTHKFTVPPVDVFPAANSGAELPFTKRFGSPVIVKKKVTFFSATQCDDQECGPPRAVYATTIGTKTAALKKKSAYNNQKLLSGAESVPNITVASKSKTRPYFTMYQFAGSTGEYHILKAPAPTGPWTKLAEGTLPKCNTTQFYACISITLHPEFSSSSRMVFSYYVPGYGPGLPKHKDHSSDLGHVVLSSVPA